MDEHDLSRDLPEAWRHLATFEAEVKLWHLGSPGLPRAREHMVEKGEFSASVRDAS